MLGKLSASLVAVAALLAAAPQARAFEDTDVLPKGVRNLDVRAVSSDLDQKTDGQGNSQPLAEPLAKDLTFTQVAKEEEQLRAQELRAFLRSNNFNESDAVGQFTADLKGHVSVVAPIASYGLTDKLTFAVAVPVYAASTSLRVGFKPNATAQAFIAALARPENNQVASAYEAADKLNHAVERLNTKLVTDGYRQLNDWQARGLGDATLAAKYRFYAAGPIAVATTAGFVAPTGRTDDPDVLNDIAFGDGQWDTFDEMAVDERLGGDFRLDQFGKYTVQLPGRRQVRAVTADEPIDVGYASTRFKLGDKIDAGTSVKWEPAFGLIAGVGYTYFRKFGDVYRAVSPATKGELEKGTDQHAHNAEFVLGYSTVPFYRRKAFSVPLDAELTYIRQMSSANMPVADQAQFDFNLYF